MMNVLRVITIPVMVIIGVLGAVICLEGLIATVFGFDFVFGIPRLVVGFIAYKISEWVIKELS